MKKTAFFLSLLLSGCSFFYGSKKEEVRVETPVVVEEKAPEPEQPEPEQSPPEPNEIVPPETSNPEPQPQEPVQQLSYREKILFLRNYLLENQVSENNLHEYELEGLKVYVSLPVKKNIFGRNDLLYTEVITNNESTAYVHFPEDEYPNAALSGKQGILESLLKVYESGENLEWYIYWNYTINKPPKQEQLQNYEQIISELEKSISNK